jgi:transcriptional regulator with XRE-family HTH domain
MSSVEKSQVSLYNKEALTLQRDCKVILNMHETLGALIQRRLNELGMSKAELAKRVGVSRAYVGDLANQTAKTQTGSYRPGPEVVEKLARHLDISTTEILAAMGYSSNGGSKPQTVAEFVQRLSAMGFDIQLSAEYENLGPDELQDLIDQIEANILIKSRRTKR